MRDFIDKTSTQSGTPINRANMLAVQGIQPETYIMPSDITTIMSNNDTEKLQIYPLNYTTRTQTIMFTSGIGTDSLKKVTITLTLNGDGTITKEIS